MKKREWLPGLQMIAALLFSLTIFTALVGRAVRMEKEAGDLSRAVLAAQNAAAAYYSAEDDEELKLLLMKTFALEDVPAGLLPTNGYCWRTAEDLVLTMDRLAGDGGLSKAVIYVLRDDREIYRLECEKYVRGGDSRG